jgi:hypothetical protein
MAHSKQPHAWVSMWHTLDTWSCRGACWLQQGPPCLRPWYPTNRHATHSMHTTASNLLAPTAAHLAEPSSNDGTHFFGTRTRTRTCSSSRDAQQVCNQHVW